MITIPSGLLELIGETLRIKPPLTVESLLGGVAATTFRVTAASGCALVVALSEADVAERALDVCAISRARSAGIRVPPLPVALLQWSGLSVVVRPYVPAAARFKTLELLYSEAGSALRTLHRQAAPFARASIYADLAEEAAVAIRHADHFVIQAAYRLLESHAELSEMLYPTSYLTHGDHKRANWIVTSDSDNCYIDWEKSCSIDPLSDLAFALVHCGGEGKSAAIASAALVRGYLADGSVPWRSQALVERYVLLANALLVHDWYRSYVCDVPDVRRARDEYLESYVRPAVSACYELQGSIVALIGGF